MVTAPLIFNPDVLKDLAEAVGNDPAAIDELLETSLPDLATQVDAVAQAALSDAPALKKAAHTLKGGSGSIGAGELRTRAAELEQRARDGRFGPDVQDDVAALRAAYARFAKAVAERRYR